MKMKNSTTIKKIILLVGMPGSGKTTLGNKFLKPTVVFLDDISKLTDNAKEYLTKLKEEDGSISELIISDVFFCQEFIREKALLVIKEVFPCAKIEEIYFENDKEKCIRNVNRRLLVNDDRKVFDLINNLSIFYKIPKDKGVIIIND